MRLILLLLLVTSCASLESTVNEAKRITEIRVPVRNNWSIGKDGFGTSGIMLEPTRLRPNINGVRYPAYYGATITIKF